MARLISLARLLANRRWTRYSEPFPHVVARDVFQKAFYRELESQFQEALIDGVGRPGKRQRFVLQSPEYDAYVLLPDRGLADPLRLFISRSWHDLLAELFDVKTTLDVQCAFHHHSVGSATGWVHSDIGLRYFMDAPHSDGISLACAGRTPGAANAAGQNVRPVVRAIAMIFYLNNTWSPGRGGETGLYRSVQDPPTQPVARVPPLNNSLLAFECSPYSFHAFLKNHEYPRNSVNLWLYRPKADVVARWGEDKIYDVERP